MSTTVAPIPSSILPAVHSQRQTPPTPPAAPAAADRIAAPAPVAPLLTVGAAALAQLVPGVVEAEAAGAIATTIGIGLRAAMANPLAGIALGVAGSELAGYAKTLAHDAFAGQPGSHLLTSAASSFDSSLHVGLGIPPSSDR